MGFFSLFWHQLLILFLSISCLERVILPCSMIFVFCSQQLLESLTLLPGRSDHLASSSPGVKCRMYWHSHQRGLLESLERQGCASHGKMCTVTYPTSLGLLCILYKKDTVFMTAWVFGGSYLALLGSISPHDHFKLEDWESSAYWIAAVPRDLKGLEK